MKAAFLDHYDKNGTNLAVRETQDPVPTGRNVLVKVLYAGVNPVDNLTICDKVKLLTPYKTPFIMGYEFVGIVEELGPQASGFDPGDRVYARLPLEQTGAFAEKVLCDVDALALVPSYLGDEEAACVPLAALTAQQAYALMDPKPGMRLFISGGTGSLGTLAIPLAKSLGLTVVTNGSAKNEARVRALGADEFIDYRTQDFAEVLHDIDFVLDTLGPRAIAEELSIMKRSGVLVSLSSQSMPNRAFAKRMGYGAFKSALFSLAGWKLDHEAKKHGVTYQFVFVHGDGEGLSRISDVLAEHDVHPSVDEVFSLDEVNEALAKVKRGGSKGKTLLKIA